MSKLVSVYGKRPDGEMELLKRGIDEEEAKRMADAFWHETGRTAAIVLCEDKEPEQEVRDPEEFEDFLTERMDELDNAVYALLRTFQTLPEPSGGGDDPFPWDMEVIGTVSECIEEILSERGFSFCRPYSDGNEEPCFLGDECKHENCPFRKES